jgi:hypothetical protein
LVISRAKENHHVIDRRFERDIGREGAGVRTTLPRQFEDSLARREGGEKCISSTA